MTFPPNGVINYLSVPDASRFRGWRGAAFTFGLIAVILGSLGGCGGIFFPLLLLVPAQPQPLPVGQVISTSILYLSLGGGLIWLGIGAMRMQRWVRPLILILGTLTLLGGLLGVILISFALPAMTSAMAAAPRPPGQPPVPTGVFRFGMIFAILFMGFFIVVLPAAAVWFFHHARVKEMLEFFDPRTRWTDRCPIPALALPVTLTIIGATQLLSLGGVGQGMPSGFAFFGTLHFGILAVIEKMIVTAIAFLLVRATYRLRPGGWLGTMILQLVWGISYALTMATGNLVRLYESAGLRQDQLQMLQRFQDLRFLSVCMPIATLIACTVYLLKVRKYFTIPPQFAAAVPLGPNIE